MFNRKLHKKIEKLEEELSTLSHKTKMFVDHGEPHGRRYIDIKDVVEALVAELNLQAEYHPHIPARTRFFKKQPKRRKTK